MRQGFLIALEGVDGSGKSTQARLLARALEERGYEVVLTREPSAGPIGEKLRQYLLGPERHLTPAEEWELFTADRRDHVQQVIKPALARSCLVITDRYYYSTVAYQGALGLDPAQILAKNEAFAPRPDLVLVLRLPISQALARRTKTAAQPRQLSEAGVYLEKVAALYDTLTGPHHYQVDAAGSPEATHARVLELTLKALKEWEGRESKERT